MILQKTIKYYVKEMWRWPLRRRMRRALRNREFSLITANCVGGILSHDVGEQFRSPTINLIIPDFLTFCENLERYINETSMIPNGFTVQGYPVCMLDELEIIGVHYSCHEELINCWNRRKTRVNFSCIFLMATDSFINNQEKAIRFDVLPWPKVCFTANPNINYGWMVYCPEFSDNKEVGDILRYTDLWGTRIFEKNFDCVAWLNQGSQI